MRLIDITDFQDAALALSDDSISIEEEALRPEENHGYQTSYKGLFHFVRYIEQLQKYDVDFGEASSAGEEEDLVRIMTIHKSKGLEFPIVFVSGIGKKFNDSARRSKLVIHPDLGIGLDEIRMEPKIKIPCMLRQEIINRIESDDKGEELRVLYVALTRAKEKNKSNVH